MKACGVDLQPPRLPTSITLRVGARMRQTATAHQLVDQDHVGDAQGARCLERHQLRVAGSCTNQEDLSHARAFATSMPCAFHWF